MGFVNFELVVVFKTITFNLSDCRKYGPYWS